MKQLLFACLVAMSSISRAQVSHPGVLKVGDVFPDHEFTSVLNYSKPSLKVSDFKGKIVLFDLWSTHCLACINSWPKLLKLQQEFSKDIQIILVNPWQDRKSIVDIYAKRKRVGGVDVTLPTVFSDSLILRMIPAVTVPHVVWIDQQGIISSVTHGEIVNEKSLTMALKEHRFDFPQKGFDLGKQVDPNVPLYINDNPGPAPRALWQSILTVADPSIPRLQGVNCYEGVCVAQGINSSVTELYQIAYGTKIWTGTNQLMMVPYNRIVLDVADPSIYSYTVNHGEVNYANFLNYSLMVPLMDRTKVQRLMQQDLDRYFGLEVKWEKRKVPSYVIKCTDTTAIAYKSGAGELALNSSEFRVNKLRMSEIVNWLEYGTGYVDMPYPIFDETGYKGLVGHIAIEVNTHNPEKLNEALKKYNMSFTLEMREEFFLVLIEKQ